MLISRVDSVLKNVKALWTRNWDTTSVPLDDRCSDNEDEWEGFEEQMDES